MPGGSNRKIANSLVTASGAAVLAVYIAGYVRTESAANRFATQVAERRLADMAPRRVASVADGLHAKTTVIPPGILPEPRHSANMATARPASPATGHPVHGDPTVAPAVPDSPHPVGTAPEADPVSAIPEHPGNAASPAAPESDHPLAAPPATPALTGSDHPLAALPAAPAFTGSDQPPAAPAAAPAHLWKDGTYTGWGFSRHGNIEASVVIEAGRIASAVISQCRTRYSCSVIGMLPPQVAQRQSPDVDYVSGATQSADAFYEAVVAALNKAK
jgi:uncharacterized protein with FMN-binding domain